MHFLPNKHCSWPKKALFLPTVIQKRHKLRQNKSILGLKVFVPVKTFWRRPFAPSHNFWYPDVYCAGPYSASLVYSEKNDLVLQIDFNSPKCAKLFCTTRYFCEERYCQYLSRHCVHWKNGDIDKRHWMKFWAARKITSRPTFNQQIINSSKPK